MRALMAAILIASFIASAEEPAAVAAGGGEFRVELLKPASAFYVVGEKIPMTWRFTNTTGEPLGLLWESCCLTYGEIVTESANGQFVPRKRPPAPPLPAGVSLPADPKAALAWHALPQITEVAPGASVTFETALDDWVEIQKSGRYTLTAQYTGAPGTALQRHSRIKLWNGKISAAPIAVDLLMPQDYLARKQDFALSAVLNAAPASRTILAPANGPLKLNYLIRNNSDKPVTVSRELWILDDQGRRLHPAATRVNDEPLTIPANATQSVDVSITPGDLLGSPLGANYSAFLDFTTADGARFPSAAASFEWRIERTDVVHLLREAAKFPGRRGERSEPVRLLRFYAKELQPLLADPTLIAEFKDDEAGAKALLAEFRDGPKH